MRAWTIAVVLISSCSGGRAPIVGASHDPVAAAPVENRPSELPRPGCEGHDELIVLASPPIAASWSGAMSTGGTGTLDVRWCGALDAEVVTVTIPADRGGWQRTFAPGMQPLRHGEVAHLPVSGRGSAGTQPVVVTARRVDGVEVIARGALRSIDDPRLVAAKTACDQCGGAWGTYGMRGLQRCDCPTRDAGQRCTTDRDCESVCVATGWEPTAAPIDGCAPGASVELVGRCHDRQLAFGCLARAGNGQRTCSAGARRLPMVCAD